MNYLEKEDELQHFGIKGMKWGSRKNSGSKTPRIGQLSSRIEKNLSARKNLKRINEKQIATLKKNDPKRRELIDKNKDLTNMNSTAEQRLARNSRIKKRAIATARGALFVASVVAGSELVRRHKLDKQLAFEIAQRMARNPYYHM